ncbi:MAG: 50S ribosomal protein L19 [Parcubacteria group bacterium]|nr:50S ribosomal protein L19 [Parcubacteria group bacterium]
MEQAVISPVNIEDRKNIGIRPGDTVRVWQKIQEKGKTRLQAFEGVVLARKHGNEAGGTFTVRRMTGGIGVEKIYPLYSPMIDRVEIVKRAKVRRAKLYHIREKVTREIRRAMRRMQIVDLKTMSDTEEKTKAALKEAEEAAKEAEVEAEPEEVKEEVVVEEEKVEEADPAVSEETPKEDAKETKTSSASSSDQPEADLGKKE